MDTLGLWFMGWTITLMASPICHLCRVLIGSCFCRRLNIASVMAALARNWIKGLSWD